MEEGSGQDRRAYSLAELPERVPEGGSAGDRHLGPQEDHQGRVLEARGRVEDTLTR